MIGEHRVQTQPQATHSAKGQEWTSVFLLNAGEEPAAPHGSAALLHTNWPPAAEQAPSTYEGCRLLRTCTAVRCSWRRICPVRDARSLAGHYDEAGRVLGAEVRAGSVPTHSRAPIASRMSMCALSTMSSIEDVVVNIAIARPKISARVGRCGR